jgi:hypothetical protein
MQANTQAAKHTQAAKQSQQSQQSQQGSKKAGGTFWKPPAKDTPSVCLV